jgi:RimJ/RimL family protein N-acetyltransferase
MRFPDDVPLLSDGRVTLRAHRPEDIDAITEQCQDPEMQRFTVVPVPYSRDDAVAFVGSRPEGWARGTELSFAVETPEGVGPSRFAGSIALRPVAAGIAGMGFGAHPAVRGHGVMTAALRLLTDWAFTERGITRLQWACIVGNLPSWRVAWRNGFRFEALTRKSQPQRGELLDSWTAVLLSHETRAPKHRWLPAPVLTGERVALRPLQPSDETRYLEAAHDPETHVWLHEIPLARDSEAFRDRIHATALAAAVGHALEWAVADAETDEYLAGINLFGFGGLDHKSAEVGYRTHPAARGRGVMREAMRLVLEQAFLPEAEGGYGLERVSLDAGEGNLGSRAVARTSGFTETGRDRHCYLKADGDVVDLVRFDLLASEWRTRTGGAVAG